MQIPLKNQESNIINDGTTTKYFKLQKSTRQGDPISAYLFLFLKLPLFSLKKIKILRVSIFLTIYSYMPMIQHFF